MRWRWWRIEQRKTQLDTHHQREHSAFDFIDNPLVFVAGANVFLYNTDIVFSTGRELFNGGGLQQWRGEYQ